MKKNSNILIRLLLLACLAQFPLVSWAQAKSVWSKPLKRCWIFESNEMTDLKIASDNDKTIILPLTEGKLLGVDLDKGKKVWQFIVGETFDSEIFVNEQNILITGSRLLSEITKNSNPTTSRSLFTVNSNSGIANTLLSNRLNSDSDKVFVASEKDFLIVSQEDGVIFAVENESKKILWEKKLDLEIVTAPKLIESKLYLGTSNRSVIVLSAKSGEVLSQIPIGKIPKEILPHEGTLYVGDNLGKLRSVRLKTKKTDWETKTGGEISEVLPFNDVVLVSSNDNYEYAILKKSGKKIWKRKLAGRILGKTIIDEKFAAVFTYGSNTALLIDLDDGKIINRITLSKENYFVSAPIFLKSKLLVPTSSGLIAFSATDCNAQ